MSSILFLFIALISGSNAQADAEKTEAMKPVETIRVTDAPEQALFERVREAHLRALQHGKLKS